VQPQSALLKCFEIRGNMSNLLIENPPVVPMRQVEVSSAVEAKGSPSTAVMSPRKWLLMACVLLSISGGVRHWRDRQFRSLEHESTTCPFHLSEIPNVLGTWRSVGEGHLDPETLKLAGSSDHVLRDYADSKTNQTVSVLVVYGLAYSVFGHSPLVCYPAGGYQGVGKVDDHEFSLAGSATPIRYRTALFSKTVASVTRSYEVLWSFWHAGSWLPDVSDHFKTFRSSPALFKIQIQCPVSGNSSERAAVESLMKELAQEVNTRRAKAVAAPVKVSTAVKTLG
jgi:hypothetical protein